MILSHSSAPEVSSGWEEPQSMDRVTNRDIANKGAWDVLESRHEEATHLSPFGWRDSHARQLRQDRCRGPHTTPPELAGFHAGPSRAALSGQSTVCSHAGAP